MALCTLADTFARLSKYPCRRWKLSGRCPLSSPARTVSMNTRGRFSPLLWKLSARLWPDATSAATSASTRFRYLSVTWSATSDVARAAGTPAFRMVANWAHMTARFFCLAFGFVMSMDSRFLPSHTGTTLWTTRHCSRARSMASISSNASTTPSICWPAAVIPV